MMKLINPGSIIIECSQQSFAAQLTKGLLSSFLPTSGKRRDGSLIYEFRSQTFGKQGFLKLHDIRRSSGESFYDRKRFLKLHSRRRRRCYSENFDDLEGGIDDHDAKENGRGDLHSEEPWSSPSPSITRLQESDLFLRSSADILDPVALGIQPEAPSNWPERESILWVRLEQEAKSALPNSLRMIQKKMRLHNKGFKVLEESASCSMRKAFSSMMFIMFKLQSSVLKRRETLCHEDLETIMDKAQSDMQSSYARLFQQVFSRTPALMIYLILLLANFSLHSTPLIVGAVAQSPLSAPESATIHQSSSTQDNYSSTKISDDNALCGKEDEVYELAPSDFSNSKPSIQDLSAKETLQQGYPDLRSVAEVLQWNSFLEEAKRMKADASLGSEVLTRFVSPISVILEEAGDYLEYSEIETRYEIGLAQEPNNPVLLRNYAKFLLREIHDPERAEECFKKAVQVEPPDAESHSLYAKFLWKVRNDLWGAEEKYLEAVAAEPENSHRVSEYAEFLWRTGGKGTCYPLNGSNLNQPE